MGIATGAGAIDLGTVRSSDGHRIWPVLLSATYCKSAELLGLLAQHAHFSSFIGSA